MKKDERCYLDYEPSERREKWDFGGRSFKDHVERISRNNDIDIESARKIAIETVDSDESTKKPTKKKSTKKKTVKKEVNKYVPLSICGHCKKDTKNDFDNRTEKVIEYDFADMLCGNCRRKMRNEMVLIAMKYLDNK